MDHTSSTIFPQHNNTSDITSRDYFQSKEYDSSSYSVQPTCFESNSIIQMLIFFTCICILYNVSTFSDMTMTMKLLNYKCIYISICSIFKL